MELDVRLKRWNYLAEQLKGCERQICSSAAGLDDLCEKIQRRAVSQSDQIIWKSLLKEREYLREQAGKIRDMKAALEQIGRMYENCEESVIQAAETDARQFEEKLSVAGLQHLTQIRVFLDNS